MTEGDIRIVTPEELIEEYGRHLKILKDESSKQRSVNWKEIYSIRIKDKELYIDVLKWKLKIEKYKEMKNYLDWFYHVLSHFPYDIVIEWYNYHKQKSDFCKKFNTSF